MGGPARFFYLRISSVFNCELCGGSLGSVAPKTMYDEIVRLLQASHSGVKADITRNGSEVQVDPEDAKIFLPRLVSQSGADFFLQSQVVDAIMQDDALKGVVISSPYGLISVYASCVVDCTGDGFVAAVSGAEFELGRSEDGACQPTTLEFTIMDVDENRAITCFGGSDPVRLPDGREYATLCKEASRSGELPENVTIVRLHRTYYTGERGVNATQANGYDALSLQGISNAELALRNQINEVVNFLRKNVPGYEYCRVKSSAATLGVRETRRITGEYTLQDSDVEKGAKFEDVIVHNAWFLIDIHNPCGGGQAEKHSQPAKPYDIPYRCLVPKKIDNLLVAGRCISGTHRAHASYRVMAICMAMGEAAGVAASLCAAENVPPRKLPCDKIQAVLQKRGIALFD